MRAIEQVVQLVTPADKVHWDVLEKKYMDFVEEQRQAAELAKVSKQESPEPEDAVVFGGL